MRRIKILDIFAVAIILAQICVVLSKLSVTFDPPVIKELLVDSETNATVSFQGPLLISEPADDIISLRTEPESVAAASFIRGSWNCDGLICNYTIKVEGRFLGFAEVFVLQKDSMILNG